MNIRHNHNVATVGQSGKMITDPSRLFHCGVCRHPIAVRDFAPADILGILTDPELGNSYFDRHRPECPSCFNDICMYCGCADTAPCIRSEYATGEEPGACSWQLPGICDFCFQELAQFLYLEATGRQPTPFPEPARPGLLHAR